MPQLWFAIEEPGPAMETALRRALVLARKGGLELVMLHVTSGAAATAPVPGARHVQGDFLAEVSRAAVGAGLVVLPDGPTAGHRAVQLAQRAAVPVLVAREERPNSTVVVTVVADGSLSEIRQASTLADWLSAPLVVLHDAATAGTPAAERLRSAAKELAPSADLVFTHSADPLRAVLDAEVHYRCDVVVLCAAPPTGSGLAESVVRRVRGSVMVTPG